VKLKQCLENVKAGVLKSDFSDHYTTIISIRNVVKEKRKSVTFKKMNATLSAENWTDLYEDFNVNVTHIKYIHVLIVFCLVK
jgi:hypothetical protein